MHFSRNPPGPNTSCIDGFADSVAAPWAEPSGATPATAGSSSTRKRSPRTVFAARLTFDSGGSPAALDARFARNPPLFSPYETERPATITHPFPWPPSPACSQATRRCISLVSRHLRVVHASCFCGVILLSPCATVSSGDRERFPFREGERRPIHRGVPYESQQSSFDLSRSLARRLVPGFLQRSTKYMQGQLQSRRNSHREFDSCLGYAFGQPFYPVLPGHHHTNYIDSCDRDCRHLHACYCARHRSHAPAERLGFHRHSPQCPGWHL